MSLFEWLGESCNPGPIGGVGRHAPPRRRRRSTTLLVGLIALAVVVVPAVLIVGEAADPW